VILPSSETEVAIFFTRKPPELTAFLMSRLGACKSPLFLDRASSAKVCSPR
jgi:hypothetical protein